MITRAILPLLMLGLLLSSAMADDFAVLNSTPRLQRAFTSLTDFRYYRWPGQVAAALSANAVGPEYPAPQHQWYGPVALCTAGSNHPIAELDVAIVDEAQGDLVVAGGDVFLAGDATESRQRLATLRASLLRHRRDDLVVRCPAKKMAVVGHIPATAALPRLLSFGPTAGRGFDHNLPVSTAELELLFRTLLHRNHPADSARIAESPLLQRYLRLLLDQDEPINVVGQVLEVLVRQHMSESSHPGEAYWCTGGLEYRYAGSDQVVGELDILAIRKSDRKIVLIGECKLSSGESFKKALAKAQKQMQRIRAAIEGPDADNLVFTYLPDPTQQFTIENFRGVDTTYRTYGSSGAVAYGFDEEIELARPDGDVLFREAAYHHDHGRPAWQLMSRGNCRKLLALRRPLVEDRRRHDSSVAVVYGQRSEAMERFYPSLTAPLRQVPHLPALLTAYQGAAAPWHEVAEVIRNHKVAIALLANCEGIRCNALLMGHDYPPYAAAAILAAHPSLDD